MNVPQILMAVLFSLLPWTANACDEKHDFDKSGSSLTISDTTFNFSKEQGQNIVSTMGTIKNSSESRAEDIVVEVKYLDATKNMIDVTTQPLFGIVVPPGQEVAFRVRDSAARAPGTYASSVARVSSAEQRTTRTVKPKDYTSIASDLLVTWGPMLLLIAVWIFMARKYSGRNSLQGRMVVQIEQQNALLGNQIAVLERLSAAVEKAGAQPR